MRTHLRNFVVRRSIPLVVAAAALMLAAGSTVSRADEPKPVFADEYEEFVRLKKKLAEADKEMKKASAEAPDIRKEMESIKEQDAKIDTQIASLQYLDKLAYEKIGKAADLQANMALARSFLRSYPKSEYRAKVEEQLKAMQASVENEVAKKAKAEEEVRLARKALDDRFARRELSLDEFRAYIRGKSQVDVVKLMGEPFEKRSNYWEYRTGYIMDEGRRKAVTLVFDAGRVTSVILKD